MRQLYTTKPRKQGLTVETAKGYLRDLIDMSDKTIYTSLVNLNGDQHRFSYVMMFVIVDGKPENISYYAAFVTGLRVKDEKPTPYLQIKKGLDVGKHAVQLLQRELYRDVFMKERLEQEWV